MNISLIFCQNLTKINELGQKMNFMNINYENKVDHKNFAAASRYKTLNYLRLKFFRSRGKQTFICGRD